MSSNSVLPPSSPAPEAIEALDHTIRQISWLGQRQFMQLLAAERFDLTLPQFYTLLYLQETAGECKMSALAEATHQSAASLTGVVDRLIQKGLVQRERHESDRRQVLVVVTQRGRQLLAEINQARQEQMIDAISHVPQRDLRVLLELLSVVVDGMQRAVERSERSW